MNLIGEHTDYNGGLSLPFAIARGVTVTAEPLDGDRFRPGRSTSARRTSSARRSAHGLAGVRARHGGRAPPPATTLRPCALEIEGDIERGAGLSSSAAMEAALCLALLAAGGRADRRELARLCSRVENDWVGAQTGLLDQLASLCGRARARDPDRLRVAWRSSRSRSRSGTGRSSRSTPAPRTRTPSRATTSAAPSAGRRASGSGSLRCATARPSSTACPSRCRPRAPRRHRERPRRRDGGRAARGRPRGGGPAARRLARQPARRLRGVGTRGRGHRRAAEGRGRGGRADGRRRLRRRGARATAAGGRPDPGSARSVPGRVPRWCEASAPRRRRPAEPHAGSSPSTISSPSGRSSAQAIMRKPKTSMPRPAQRLMLTPAALSISAWLSVSPRMVSSRPRATKTPPMMRRRSNRFAAWAARELVCWVSDMGYQKMMVRRRAPPSVIDPSSAGDSHQAWCAAPRTRPRSPCHRPGPAAR